LGAIEDRLAELGLDLPEPFTPPGLELPFEWVRVSGSHAYVSGHGPLAGNEVIVQGKVGADVTPERGYEAARLTALSMLASLKRQLGDLDRITGWVKALGLVNCAPGFNGTPGVINGFSDLVLELWGDAGRHARSAIGAAELPFDMAVEVEAIVELEARGGRRPRARSSAVGVSGGAGHARRRSRRANV
jgi:enamine deaminase RidA (YjgF/YER057c/UK114 family)